MNNVHERALRIVYRDYESTFQQLLKQNNSVPIHQRNLQILATEIFKTKNGLNPVIMEDVFKFKNLVYNFRNAETLNSNVNSVTCGTEAINSLGAKIQKMLPNDYKELTFLSNYNPKLEIGKQINALADYAKNISSEMVLLDWALLRQINVC